MFKRDLFWVAYFVVIYSPSIVNISIFAPAFGSDSICVLLVFLKNEKELKRMGKNRKESKNDILALRNFAQELLTAKLAEACTGAFGRASTLAG